MELLLNFVWLAVSLLLMGSKFWSMRSRGERTEWRVLIALGVLLMMMLPVISITDDLMAVNAAADVEHMLRRPLEPIDQGLMLAVVGLVAAAAFVLDRLRQQRILETISRTDSNLVRLRQGLVRLFGVRPPPARPFA